MKDVYKVNGILEINYKCRGYCKCPYHGHKKGCPNFNVNLECPPKVGKIEDVFDTSKDMFFVTEEFNLEGHIKLMKNKHPLWTERQCKNLLYWQNSVRRKLTNKVLLFIGTEFKDTSDLIYTLLPEAMGVMVINTAQKLGIPIERNPIEKVFKIALVGYRKENSNVIKTL